MGVFDKAGLRVFMRKCNIGNSLFYIIQRFYERATSAVFVLYFLWFPLCRGEAGLVVTPLYGYFCNFFYWSVLLAFSLHFSSSSAFLISLFTQSSHLSCRLPRFLQPSCFFVSDLSGDLSSFILTMCPAHFIQLLTIFHQWQHTLFHIFQERSISDVLEEHEGNYMATQDKANKILNIMFY